MLLLDPNCELNTDDPERKEEVDSFSHCVQLLVRAEIRFRCYGRH